MLMKTGVSVTHITAGLEHRNVVSACFGLIDV